MLRNSQQAGLQRSQILLQLVKVQSRLRFLNITLDRRLDNQNSTRKPTTQDTARKIRAERCWAVVRNNVPTFSSLRGQA